MTDEDKQLIALLQGDTGTPKVDMGPAARAALPQPAASLGGMRPAIKPDDVAPEDLRSDYGKRDVRRTIQGRQDLITTPDARAARDERAAREDPIKNDPLAGSIAQGIVAGGATKVLAPIAGPLLSRMVGGAVASPDHPVAGAALGALPAVPGAVRAADNAVGEAALNRVTAPASAAPGLASKVAAKTADAVGGAVGSVIGHKVGGIPGAVAGGVAGGMARTAVNKGINSVAQRLADRHMARMAAMRAAGTGTADTVVAPLAPLKHEPPPEVSQPRTSGNMARGPNGPIGPNEFDEGVGDAPPAGNHATVGGATQAGPRSGMSPAERGAAHGSLEDQLSRSVEILGDLRVASATGTVTPMMLKEALDAGIPATTVYHVVGDKVAANAALKKALTGE